MRPLKQFQLLEGEAAIIALDENGDLWAGALNQWLGVPEEDSEIPTIEWVPLNGPPDGEHLQKAFEPFWDTMEKQARE
jgi:hypothetical protein